MQPLTKGRYRVRLAETPTDIRSAQRLRHLAFHGTDKDRAAPAGNEALDLDAFDGCCQHVLIEDCSDDQLVGCFRGLELGSGAEIGASYSAQFYDLDRLTAFCGRMIEIGRFCIHPDRSDDPDILRLAWASLARHVESRRIEMMFGCSSFQGTDQGQYLDTFALLKSKHLAPPEWRPRVKAQKVFRFAARLRRLPDRRKALQAMPPLLRTYLMMGGWVSDHAVIDTEMDTLHVFTGVEISAIPAARRNLLLAV